MTFGVFEESMPSIDLFSRQLLTALQLDAAPT